MSWLKRVIDRAAELVEQGSPPGPAPRTAGAIMDTQSGPGPVPAAHPEPAASEPAPGHDGPAAPPPWADTHAGGDIAGAPSLASELQGWYDAGPAARLDDLARQLGEVAQRQADLNQLFESRIYSDDLSGKALEKLHDQLRDYRTNFVREEMKPLLRDLTFCYDFAAGELEVARAAATGTGPPPSPEQTREAFEHLLQMIADVLSKYDIEAFRSDGDVFDQKTQQCVRTVPTDVEADHKKVAAVGAIGFRAGELILRKEQVTVYKYTAGRAGPAQGGSGQS